jgi:Cell wall-associated hydrolases (invasion-associated proteins)
MPALRYMNNISSGKAFLTERVAESRRGVDCSAFMQLTFREQFAMQLPRDTDSQAHIGRAISSRQLRPGDLVFFNIGRSTRMLA